MTTLVVLDTAYQIEGFSSFDAPGNYTEAVYDFAPKEDEPYTAFLPEGRGARFTVALSDPSSTQAPFDFIVDDLRARNNIIASTVVRQNAEEVSKAVDSGQAQPLMVLIGDELTKIGDMYRHTGKGIINLEPIVPTNLHGKLNQLSRESFKKI